MTMDITDILAEWPYDPGSCVRKITAEDGREVIQVRTPLGIEQYEVEGRPDGAEPYGRESVLEHVEEQLVRYVAERGSADGFRIDTATAAELQQEGVIYYYRYLVCFQIGEYGIVIRDTYRNLKMFDFVKQHCKDAEAVNGGEQYRPYVMRMNAAARALMAVGAGKYSLARGIVQKAVREVSGLEAVPTATFEYERQRSLAILRGMLKAIPPERRPTAEDVLRRELHQAVAEENYERAAAIRDRLKNLGAKRDGSRSATAESSA